MLMRTNKVEIAVQLFRISHTVLAGFSGHDNSIHNIIPLFKKFKKMYICFLAHEVMITWMCISSLLGKK